MDEQVIESPGSQVATVREANCDKQENKWKEPSGRRRNRQPRRASRSTFGWHGGPVTRRAEEPTPQAEGRANRKAPGHGRATRAGGTRRPWRRGRRSQRGQVRHCPAPGFIRRAAPTHGGLFIYFEEYGRFKTHARVENRIFGLVEVSPTSTTHGLCRPCFTEERTPHSNADFMDRCPSPTNNSARATSK